LLGVSARKRASSISLTSLFVLSIANIPAAMTTTLHNPLLSHHLVGSESEANATQLEENDATDEEKEKEREA
jgi:hypothetical protein